MHKGDYDDDDDNNNNNNNNNVQLHRTWCYLMLLISSEGA
jgi:hypothetical protein